MSAPDDWSDINRRNWDERVPIHVASTYYDVAGFRAGKGAVEPWEISDLGCLDGLRFVHLQCHFGMDTLDLARRYPSSSAVGLDFSEPAVAAAVALADQMGLSSRCSFVHGDVLAAATLLGAGQFDLVYTGKGALCWLQDLRPWAVECFELLKPGGTLYVSEFHPVGYTLSQTSPTVTDDYFRTEPWVDNDEGTYADLSAPTRENTAICWNHPLFSIFGALWDAGFTLTAFREFDETLFQQNQWVVPVDEDHFRWPSDDARLPLMFSLKAVRPAA
ncbi:MAG TPA: class I SAM-dependent methyltransferase [Acidimicrobiales bacterium]|nr:class I SAM-dependent methyltransferase [Acidimicrobiales bacterium]